MTLIFPEIILLESSLSFLGLGVQPADDQPRQHGGLTAQYITRAPWIMRRPALTIVTTTLAARRWATGCAIVSIRP